MPNMMLHEKFLPIVGNPLPANTHRHVVSESRRNSGGKSTLTIAKISVYLN